MGTKTIGLDEEAYDQLKAEKREGESFSDVVKRITDEVARDWRHSIDAYGDEQADEFADAVHESRERTNRGLARRARDVERELAGGSSEEPVGEESNEGDETTTSDRGDGGE